MLLSDLSTVRRAIEEKMPRSRSVSTCLTKIDEASMWLEAAMNGKDAAWWSFVTTTAERHCKNCKHEGWDPDGSYCAHPKVIEKHPIGLALRNAVGPGLSGFCPHSEGLPLFEKREES